uniref:Spermatogenesis-associated protein 4 n=1 Tax=Iconisemion striatum TaxID=60296 RepID=A0A1A7XA86_9TELE
MNYAMCSEQTALPRDVVKWLQSLLLSVYPKNVRRDLSNGYLLAEIFSHYYPREFSLHLYDKGVSLSAKQKNWSQIQQFIKKHNLHLMKEAIDGTIHCKPGAAELLVQEVYTILTNQRATDVRRREARFSDEEYQKQLPSVARSTASKAIKNNLTATEITAEPDISTNQRKAQIILRRHLEHKAAEKILNPGRFQVRCDRNQLVAELPKASNQDEEYCNRPSSGKTDSNLSTRTGTSDSFKEIKVNQPVRHSLLDY